MVLYYLKRIIIFLCNYEIIGILIDYLKFMFKCNDVNWCGFTKVLLICGITLY